MSRHWPLHTLRITTPNLELRVPDDPLVDELIDLAAQGIHDPADMPFLVPWTDAVPPEFQRNTFQYYWRTQAAISPTAWELSFAVLRDGVVVGTQTMEAVDFSVRRTFQTGSWIGRAHQGQGIGKEMRRAVLTLGFDHLGAVAAMTAVIEGNEASRAVTHAIGYEPNGWEVVAPRGNPVREEKFVLTRDRWESLAARIPIRVDGLDDCLPLLGLG